MLRRRCRPCTLETHQAGVGGLGVRCIGAGVRDDTGLLVSGLSISSPAERMKPEWAALVQETAIKISRAIGWQGQTSKEQSQPQ